MDSSLQPNGPNRDEFVCMIHALYHEILLLYAYNLCNRFGYHSSKADDLLQDFYKKLLENHEYVAHMFNGNNVEYLCGIIRYRMLDINRKRKKDLERDEKFSGGKAKTGTINSMRSEKYYENFFLTLDEILADQDSQLIKLYCEGYSYKEIGALLDIKTSTVGVKIHRVKKILANYLD